MDFAPKEDPTQRALDPRRWRGRAGGARRLSPVYPDRWVGPLASHRTDRACRLGDVRYGSIADMRARWPCRFPPKADMPSVEINVR